VGRHCPAPAPQPAAPPGGGRLILPGAALPRAGGVGGTGHAVVLRFGPAQRQQIHILGGNILILSNLLFVTIRLFKTLSAHADLDEVEKSISTFLPIYSLWIIIVAFVFPVVFGFR
jgi:hypothetical protein